MSPAFPSGQSYEDKRHHSRLNTSQVYNKERKHVDYSDVEDQKYVTRKEKGGDAGKDALADFRDNIAEEETQRYWDHGPRRADSTPPKGVRHREYDARLSDRRHRDYESKASRHHRPRDQRYSYPNEDSERQTSRHSAPKGYQDRDGTTPRGRSRSADRDITSRQRYRTGSTSKHTEEQQALPVNESKKNREDDRKGRSLSGSSSTHRSLPSRSSSPVYSYYHSHRKRRRSRSRSRSVSRERKRDGKDRKERRSSGKKRDKEKNETRRSVLTGKKLKLKVKKDKDDVERDAKRQELLMFLNSACD